MPKRNGKLDSNIAVASAVADIIRSKLGAAVDAKDVTRPDGRVGHYQQWELI